MERIGIDCAHPLWNSLSPIHAYSFPLLIDSFHLGGLWNDYSLCSQMIFRASCRKSHFSYALSSFLLLSLTASQTALEVPHHFKSSWACGHVLFKKQKSNTLLPSWNKVSRLHPRLQERWCLVASIKISHPALPFHSLPLSTLLACMNHPAEICWNVIAFALFRFWPLQNTSLAGQQSNALPTHRKRGVRGLSGHLCLAKEKRGKGN